ncbi:hypothetical protein NUK47_02085 [Aeromonas hydrophila]|uniref:hypothetical protein n=1 Tax=Aeromonas hydrophila TaxID=644 RepID=UPI00214DDF07|nr:hypothetical protein [Aeromonas hydrophila]MCR3907557.1 hypothetical protein [Aeromonas hydrophila]
MAGVNIVLSANTQKYINDINKAKRESINKFDAMGKKAQEFGDGVSNAFNSPQSAIQGFLTRLGPVGMVAGGAAVAIGGMSLAALKAGQAVMGTQKQLEALSKTSGMSIEDMNKQAIAASTFGIEMDKLGDILKDVNDKTGDYLSTGGGALQDYFYTISGKINRTADDFRGLGSMQILKMVQQDLDDVGASAAQQTFVLESLASDASKLGPLLRMTQQDIDNMLTTYATKRATLSQDTINDIQATQNNIDMLQSNFNTALAESFRGLTSLAGEMSKKVSDLFYEISEGAKSQNIIRSYMAGGMSVNSGNAQDFLDNAQSIQDQTRVDARVRATKEVQGLPFGDEYWKKVDELTNKYIDEANKRLSQDVIQAADYKNAEALKKQSSGTAGNAKAPDTATAAASLESLKALQTQRTAIMVQQGKLETQLQNAIGEETRKELTSQIGQQKALLERNAEDIKSVNGKIAGYNAEAYSKRQAALKSLASTEQEIARYGYQQQLEELKKFLQEGSLTQDEFNRAKVIAEQALSDKLLDIKKKELDEKRKLAQQEYNDRVSAMNLLKDFATTQEQISNQELLIKRAEVEEAYRLDQEKGEYSILTEQDKNNKLAQIDREFKAQDVERDTEHMNSKEEAELIRAESERELLLEQYQQKIIDKEEFDKQIVLSDEKVTNAKKDLALVQLNTMSELFRGSAQLAEQGSKQQKVLFAMEKASTIATMGLKMWEAWSKETEPGWTGIAKKAAVLAQYGGAIVSAGAVTLGQFHSGTDEVDSTGSYILKAGERVVQPEANRDLTAYLESRKFDSAGIEINSDLVIQGDTTISDEKFQSMLAQHRESLLQFYNLAKRESGI